MHEFQHAKLGGLIHLVDLLEDDDRKEIFYAPWRDDPRPLGGLFQGVYAFLGVTAFWRTRTHVVRKSPAHRLAAFEFAFNRARTSSALATLRAAPGLTALGRRFTVGMAATMHDWWSDEVPADALAAANLAATDHRIGWRIRHLRADPGYIMDLERAWDLGRLVGLGTRADSVVVPDPSGRCHSRFSAIRRYFADPSGLIAAEGDQYVGNHVLSDLSSADQALLDRRYDEAADRYSQRLAAGNTGCPDDWTGLVLALACHDQAARALLGYPEILPALYRAVGGNHAVAPRRIAEWLGAILCEAA